MRTRHEIQRKLEEIEQADFDYMHPANESMSASIRWVLEEEDTLEPERADG